MGGDGHLLSSGSYAQGVTLNNSRSPLRTSIQTCKPGVLGLLSVPFSTPSRDDRIPTPYSYHPEISISLRPANVRSVSLLLPSKFSNSMIAEMKKIITSGVYRHCQRIPPRACSGSP
ncbi:hypothetical protein EVAR_63177_1 [Eumeta japonica]|uniref:Uncharacterized protein n=1 Tax=Eumeta variegata TaxID=151549 RepID=A0A4C1Z035_EUMVA|nr:hypothetical protein EVAR_63177_1 [Eumeta japonica]